MEPVFLIGVSRADRADAASSIHDSALTKSVDRVAAAMLHSGRAGRPRNASPVPRGTDSCISARLWGRAPMRRHYEAALGAHSAPGRQAKPRAWPTVATPRAASAK